MKNIEIINSMRKKNLDVYAIEDSKKKKGPPSQFFLKIINLPENPFSAPLK